MAKSKPIGVRFDLEKLELIQKEQNLKSPQAVLNYFMDNYGKIASNLADNPKIIEVFAKTKEVLKSTKNSNKEMPLGLSSVEQIQWRIDNM